MRPSWTRRSFAGIYLWSAVCLGTASLLLYQPEWSRLPGELATLVLLFGLAEYFPTRVRVGAISFSFSIAFAAFLLYGVGGAGWTAALGTIAANVARRRSWRVTWFNGAQFALATLAAGLLSNWVAGPVRLGNLLAPLTAYIATYYVTNNCMVDGLLWLRLKVYRFQDWWIKTRYEALSALISFGYSLLMIILAPQDRGHDPLALIFFFLPLLTVSTFVRLLTHLSHFAGNMATLMEVSTLVTYSPESRALETALSHLDAFDEYTYAAIYKVDGDGLSLHAVRGPAPADRMPLGEGLSGWVARHGSAIVTGDARQDPRNTLGEGAHEGVQAMAAFPLASGGQVIGVFTVAKERSHSIQPEDVRLLTIVSNLLAAILRNLDLAQHRERLLLEQERNRLAREIHDGLAQSLAGSLLQMDRLERLVESDAKGARRFLGTLREHLRETLLEVRRSIYNLRPSPLEENGLIETLRHEVQKLSDTAPANVRLEVRGEQRRLSSLVEDEVFRIAQEGLANALKHSGASEITLTLQFQEDQLRLTVRDNGQGFLLVDAVRGARDRQSFGLVGISERAERLGASFEVDSRPGAGTKLMVDIPLMGE